MKKYTKHYIEMAFDKLKPNEFFFEEDEIDKRDNEFLNKYFFDEETIKMLIETKYTRNRYIVRYPEIITSGRPLAKIRFYDISYIIDGNLVYESNKHNYSNWICFGKRVPTNNDIEERWCFDGHSNFIIEKEDVTYEEYALNYLKTSKKSNKVKKLK